MRLGVVYDHLRQLKLCHALGRHSDADQTARVIDHKRQFIARRLLRGDDVPGGVLGPGHLPIQRLVGVLVGGDRPARQMVQLDPMTGPAEDPLRRVRIKGQRLRPARIVRVQPMPPGLVVDDHRRAVARVDPVGAAVKVMPETVKGSR